ncbi:MAG TPA: hypothetical protein VJ757_16080 [Pseudonocardiaceae bacterium]|nr:hypothetical protein [Pseudonocardiaceae bacterium]
MTDYGEPHLAGWWTGLIIGLVILVAVVIVVSALLILASRINAQARVAARELEATRTTTQPLAELTRTNSSLQSILRGARAARKALGG